MNRCRRANKIPVILAVLWIPAASLATDPGPVWVVGNFSMSEVEAELPAGWEPLTFDRVERHTSYRLIKADDTVVVKAESNDSASALARKIRIDPKAYPILKWKWKVNGILEKGVAFKKKGDDFAARVYVTFEYDPSKVSLWEKIKYETVALFYDESPPLHALNYIWGNSAPRGAVIPNAYSDKARMIVVESGKERLNQWIEETRNVYEDYQAAFHQDPPMISGVAIMTDSDDTGESAVAYYGDIVFRKAPR